MVSKAYMDRIYRAAYKAAGVPYDAKAKARALAMDTGEADGDYGDTGNLAAAVNGSTGPGTNAADPDSDGSTRNVGAADDDFDLGKEVESLLTGKISDEDMAALTELFLRNADASASDLPDADAHMSAMATDESYTSRVRRQRQKLFNAGRIGYDALRAPIERPRTAAQTASFVERFPDAGRLK